MGSLRIAVLRLGELEGGQAVTHGALWGRARVTVPTLLWQVHPKGHSEDEHQQETPKRCLSEAMGSSELGQALTAPAAAVLAVATSQPRTVHRAQLVGTGPTPPTLLPQRFI